MAAVAAARLLVPIVAEPVSVDTSGEHTGGWPSRSRPTWRP